MGGKGVLLPGIGVPALLLGLDRGCRGELNDVFDVVWLESEQLDHSLVKDGAYALLNFLLEPENIAKVSNELWYPNAVPESYPLISEELRSDHALFPPDEFVASSNWCTSPIGGDTERLARFLRILRKGRTTDDGDSLGLR